MGKSKKRPGAAAAGQRAHGPVREVPPKRPTSTALPTVGPAAFRMPLLPPRPTASAPPLAAVATVLEAPRMARLSGTSDPVSRLQFVTSPLRAAAAVEPQAVGVSYWFTAPDGAGPFRVAVRFTGRRLDVDGARSPGDDFCVESTVDAVRPGDGPVAVTQRITGKRAGRWHVRADAVVAPQGGGPQDTLRLPPAEGVGSSTFAPIASALAPGVVPGAWPVMVALGFGLALAVMGSLTRAHGLSTGRALLLALVAGALGLLGAKVYYWVTHPREPRTASLAGLSLQGFVSAATVVFVLGGWALGQRIGHLLDATIPALLVGQAVGRLGCLLAGCCSGLPTSSQWAVWSSDRRIGTRRVPVQLLESASSALLAVATGLVAWRTPPRAAGFLFLAGLAAYVLVRQILFPLRGLPRATRHGRTVMLVLSPAVLVASAAVLALS